MKNHQHYHCRFVSSFCIKFITNTKEVPTRKKKKKPCAHTHLKARNNNNNNNIMYYLLLYGANCAATAQRMPTPRPVCLCAPVDVHSPARVFTALAGGCCRDFCFVFPLRARICLILRFKAHRRVGIRGSAIRVNGRDAKVTKTYLCLVSTLSRATSSRLTYTL